MKGQPEALIWQAVQQARRKADLLYQFIITANVAAQEDLAHRCRDFRLVRVYLHAVIRGPKTKQTREELRAEILLCYATSRERQVRSR